MVFLGLYSPFAQIVTHAKRYGLSVQQADTMRYFLYLASFSGQIISGRLAGKIGGSLILISAVLGNIIVQLFWWRAKEYSILIFAVAYGFTLGQIVSTTVAFFAGTAREPSMTGSYIGTSIAVLGIASFLGTSATQLISADGTHLWIVFSVASMCMGLFFLMAAKDSLSERYRMTLTNFFSRANKPKSVVKKNKRRRALVSNLCLWISAVFVC